MLIFFISILALFPNYNKYLEYEKMVMEGQVNESSLVAFYNEEQDTRISDSILKLLSNYSNYNPESIYKLCKKKLMDCTYYKAKLFESMGNAGSAMELYQRSGFFEEHIRLMASNGKNIDSEIKKARLKRDKQLFYKGLVLFHSGKWQEAVSYFTNSAKYDYYLAKVYLAYSYLMIGENNEAKKILKEKNKDYDFFKKLEFKKLEALILYADNKQIESKKIFLEILNIIPNDFFSNKYLAHIYYRTGWFDKAENIYERLISKEWRDNELFYLLQERAEMRIRYLKIDLARKDADRIINEYPDRKDFISKFISWLIEYGEIETAKKYLSSLSENQDKYQKSLYYFTSAMIFYYDKNINLALEHYKKANEIFPTKEYQKKIDMIITQLKHSNNSAYYEIDCSKYYIGSFRKDSWFVSSDKFGKIWPVKYYLKKVDDLYELSIYFKFIYDENISANFDNWLNYAENIWSKYELVTYFKEYSKQGPAFVEINIKPWPSSFYITRVSSHDWNILSSKHVIAHEIGHLLGLYDEYYEMDKTMDWRNEKRYIGREDSIMNNMLSGEAQKRHIHFILSSIKCSR
jgi:tetratricopeptide (TPR) repeat protein